MRPYTPPDWLTTFNDGDSKFHRAWRGWHANHKPIDGGETDYSIQSQYYVWCVMRLLHGLLHKP